MTPLRYVFGGMLALCALVFLFGGQFFPAFFWAFSALILFPPTLKWIQKREHQRLKTWQEYTLVFVAFFLGVFTFNPPPDAGNRPLRQKPAPPVVVHDTIFVRDTVKVNDVDASPSVSAKDTKKPPVNSLTPSPQQYNTETAPVGAKAKAKKKAAPINILPSPTAPKKAKKPDRPRGCSYNGNPLYVGPRGGCYYYTGSGRKQYVDRGYCSGCY